MAVQMTQLAARMRRGETISIQDTARVVFALSVPAILEQMVVTAMEYIDAAMVGHLGAQATAAIGVVSSSTWLFNGVMAGIATGFAVQVAQYLGAHREAEARDVLRQAILFNLFGGAVIAAVGVCLSFRLPEWLGADAALRADASAYFRIWSLAAPLNFGLSIYSSILRCSGDTRTPSLLNALACLLDVVFNFFLISPGRTILILGRPVSVWGAGLGVTGAALGTAAATCVAAAAMLYRAVARSGLLALTQEKGSWRFTRACMRNVCRVGLPMAGERVAISSAQVILIRVVTALGTVSIAANSLAVSAEAICYMPGYGIQAAVVALVGQAIGAGRRDMARRFAWLCTCAGTVLMGLAGVGLYLLAPQLIAIFTADAAVIALGAQVLRIEAFAEPLFGASIVASGAMQGAGDSRSPFLINLACMWGVRVSAAALLAPHFGLTGVWAAMCGELCLRGAAFLIRLARGRWLQKDALQ